MGWSLVQGALLSVKKDYKTEEEARAQQRAVEPLMIELIPFLVKIPVLKVLPSAPVDLNPLFP
jgi:hypothetical protein